MPNWIASTASWLACLFLMTASGADQKVWDELIELDLNGGITFDASDRGYPIGDTWKSPVVESNRPFTELLPSWAVDAPADTGVRFSGRVRWDDDTWSPWVDFGFWGEVPAPKYGESFDGGEVQVDILILDRPACAWQMRADATSYDLSEMPTLRRITMAVRGEADEATLPGEAGWSGKLDVPFVPQALGGERLMSEICSPTSVAMAAAAFGVEVDLAEHAMAVFDREHDLFGNWNRAVARANALGLDAHLERFATWQAVADHLAAGRIVIASVNYADGEAPTFIDNATNGHLIVIRGLTPDGDAIVNDPGSRDRGEAVVYAKEDLETAWFANAGGVGYVIGPGEHGKELGKQ
jgi:hypothetical protein